jgi:hypothetical protein
MLFRCVEGRTHVYPCCTDRTVDSAVGVMCWASTGFDDRSRSL